MNAKKHFTTMVIAAILFAFMGAGYVFAADYDNGKEKSDKSQEMQNEKYPLTIDKAANADQKGNIGEKTNKSMKMQSKTDSMESGGQAMMNSNNKSVLNKSTMASDLIGMTVQSKQNEDLGEVQDLILNESGRIQYMVISHGGILGMGNDRIPIPFNDATVDSENKVVTLNKIDKQMLTNAPKFTEDDWKNVGDPQFEQKMRGYSGDDFSDDYDQKNRMKQGDHMNQGNRMNQGDYDKEKMKTEQKLTRKEKMGQKSGGQEDMTTYRPLVDRTVRNSHGEDISDIENVLVSDDGSQIKAVLSVGGFLGMGDKKVLISMDELQFDPNTDYVTYRGTEEDLENRAAYEEPEERRDYARRAYTPFSSGRGYYGSRTREYGADRYGYEGGRYRNEYPESERYGRERYGRENEGRYQSRFPSGEERYSDRGYYEEQRQNGLSPQREDRFGEKDRFGRRSGDDRYQEQDRFGRQSEDRYQEQDRFGRQPGDDRYQEQDRYHSRQEGYDARYNQRQQGMYHQPRDEGRMNGRYDTRQQDRFQSREDRQWRQRYDEGRQSGWQQQQ